MLCRFSLQAIAVFSLDLALFPSCTLRNMLNEGFRCIEPFFERIPFAQSRKCRLASIILLKQNHTLNIYLNSLFSWS